MNKDLIVTIFVPTKQGSGSNSEGKIGAAERHWHPLPGQAEYLDLLRAVIGQRPDDHSAQEALLAEIKRFVFRKHPDAATEDIAAAEAAANAEAAP